MIVPSHLKNSEFKFGDPNLVKERIELSGWGIIRSFFYENWIAYIIAVQLIAASSCLSVSIPWLVGRLTDRLQRGGLSIAEAAHFSVAIIVIVLVKMVMARSGRTTVQRKSRLLTYRLRRQLFQKWAVLSPAYYHRHSVGDLLSHFLSDVEAVREMLAMGITMSANGLSMLGAVLYLMVVHVNWRLAVAGLIPMAAIPFLINFMGPKIRSRSLSSQQALGRMAQTVEEVLEGIGAVKAFGNEQVFVDRFKQKAEEIVQERMKLVSLSSLFTSLVPFLAALGFVTALGYGSFLVISKIITLGDFVAFTLYLTMLLHPLEHLGQVLNTVQRASASLDRLSELLNAVPEVQDRKAPLLDCPIKGDVLIEKLTFRYPGTDRDVLTDVSFSLGRGKTLGIVGPMGSGKTTLADLLLRLYDPPEGTIFIDGGDILHYPLSRLREGVAYTPQDGFLFSSSILENIGFADEKPDMERATKSAKISAVYHDIKRFPEGLNTEIGEHGVRLSGGQKQRVALARMIYKDSPIRILDDSLSAVDTGTERIILNNLRGSGSRTWEFTAGSGRTTLIFSHRLSTVMHADEIIVLTEGRIAERGNHERLIKSGGLYAKLWQMQSGLTEKIESTQTELAEGVE